MFEIVNTKSCIQNVYVYGLSAYKISQPKSNVFISRHHQTANEIQIYHGYHIVILNSVKEHLN
jgi:hypothetical protein